MAEIIIPVDGFTLMSSYRCITYDISYLNPDTNFTTTEQVVTKKTTEAAKPGYKVVTFPFTLPEGMKILGAQVHATLGGTLYGASASSINGKYVGTNCEAVVDVVVDATADSVKVPFSFTTKTVAHDHTWDGYIDRPGYYEEKGIYIGAHMAYDHRAYLEYSNVYLVIEYDIDTQGWTLAPQVVQPNETMTVTLEEPKAGHTYTAQATIGDYGTKETEIPLSSATLDITALYDWLYAIPDAPSGSGLVTVREYLNGELTRETVKNFALVCPDSCVPSLRVLTTEPLLTVDGVTYPAVYPDRFVQSKCGVRFKGVASGVYGSQIVSAEIESNGERIKLTMEGSNFTHESGLLSMPGFREFVIVVTDSRGRSTAQQHQIYVEPYESPLVRAFTLHRATIDGLPDEQSPYVAYEFDQVYSALDGHNKLTVTLTADGVTQTHTAAEYEGILRTGAGWPRAFDLSTRYTVELTLTDGYGSVSSYATIMPAESSQTTVVIRPTHREKRGLIIGEYDTVLDGDWTMSALALTEPEQQTNLITVPGRVSGPIDASTALTEGVPTYGTRTLTATFENSNGTRQERTVRISEMVNLLHGRRFEIIHPDYPDHYLVGRVTIKTEYNDMAHCAVTLTAICEPWKYSKMETVSSWPSLLYNGGGMTVVPTITVTGNGCSAWVVCSARGVSVYLSAGTHILPELAIHPDETLSVVVQDMGNPFFGSPVEDITFSYREAVL